MASSKARFQPENTCHFCLYLKPPPGTQRTTCGNCSLHQQWIENATRTTCSDMSNHRLESGIYHLLERDRGEWAYILRKSRIRTRLFLMPKRGV
jgi:hypothetical protein